MRYALPDRRPQAPPRYHQSPLIPENPLVTCVMLTLDSREKMARGAVRRFLRSQAGVDAELLVVYDAGHQVTHEGPRVRGVDSEGLRIPAKYQTGFGAVKTPIAAKCDDDDWYSADRLRRQIQPILDGKADIVSLHEDYALLLTDGTWWRSMHRHLNAYHDGTVVLRSDLIPIAPVPDFVPGETWRWVSALVAEGARHEVIPAKEDFVYIRHTTNTWVINRMREQFVPTKRPEWFPEEDLQEMLASVSPAA